LIPEAVDVRASEAVALFCYEAKKCIDAFTAALGGLDTLVFAGGSVRTRRLSVSGSASDWVFLASN